MSGDVIELKEKTFVPADSILREIWGKPDITLFIFAGAAAEFALNRQVEWLYFTGRLPEDPIGRLFSTVSYARRIIFRDQETAVASISRINQIHHAVETKRGARIPDESYRDVLFLLIHYSIAAYELLERSLDAKEKEDVVNAFTKMGRSMGISSLPAGYSEWETTYRYQQAMNLKKSEWTMDLFKRYRDNLGAGRYFLLLRIQAMLAPERVRTLLELGSGHFARTLIGPYRLLRRFNGQRRLIRAMVPRQFRTQLLEMGG